jgi:hypothetical protein
LKSRFLFLLFTILSVPLSGCAGGLSAEDIDSTALSMAETSVPLTLTAMPTQTPAPSETPTSSATFTMEPTAQPSETTTESSTSLPTFIATWTPYGQSDSGASGTAQADKADQNAPLFLDNHSGEEVQFTLTSPVYQEYIFSKSLTLILPEGQYTYRAKVGNASFSGSFAITNGDKHVLTFYSDRIHFSTP